MATYLQGIKAISDELSIIDHPLDETDLVIHTLNGLTVEYREISAALRSRESPIAFAELHEKLVDFETIHHRADQHAIDVVATANVVTRNKGQHYRNNNNRNSSPTPLNSDNRPVCQFCDKPGHSAKICYKIRGFPKRYGTKPTANIAQNQAATQNASWIMDTGASHHISQDLQQLTLANSYPGADQDLNSGQALLQGPLKQDLYHLSAAFSPSSPPQALHTSIQSASTWHHKL
ncbi:hypothetical protein L195_g039607, partial [Trifolium pratense]